MFFRHFYTFRRRYLDEMLSANTNFMKGKVIDIGGKKTGKRGKFIPPHKNIISWEYSNIDAAVNPDYLCDAENIPVPDNSFDTALLCEVLEHLSNPEKVLKEIYRILKNDGHLILTAPFLFPYHPDPYDFQRWTQDKYRKVLNELGFSDIRLLPMGGIGAVFHDLLYVSLAEVTGNTVRRVLRYFLRITHFIWRWLDWVFLFSANKITTGHFIIAQKNIK